MASHVLPAHRWTRHERRTILRIHRLYRTAPDDPVVKALMAGVELAREMRRGTTTRDHARGILACVSLQAQTAGYYRLD
jgi:hypothetical protein